MFRLALSHHQAGYSQLTKNKMACVHVMRSHIAYKILRIDKIIRQKFFFA
jgi:hypothetical protein